MSKLRISDAPLLPDVNGSEKIPTGGRGDYAVSVDQIKDYVRGGLPQQIEDHVNDTENPHQVTKDQVGLGNVDNTSDVDKPISTATQEALDLKADKTYVDSQDLLKADKVTTYTKTEVNSSLGLKADKATTYTKTEVDSSLSLKADKTYVDSQDLLKADKTYVDSALTGFSNGAAKFYPTLAEANADISNIAVNDKVEVGEVANGGTWYKATAGATSLTKSPYDPLTQAKADATTKANTAKSEAISASATDATTKANAAEANAKTYADANKLDYSQIEVAYRDGNMIGAKTKEVIGYGLNGQTIWTYGANIYASKIIRVSAGDVIFLLNDKANYVATSGNGYAFFDLDPSISPAGVVIADNRALLTDVATGLEYSKVTVPVGAKYLVFNTKFSTAINWAIHKGAFSNSYLSGKAVVTTIDGATFNEQLSVTTVQDLEEGTETIGDLFKPSETLNNKFINSSGNLITFNNTPTWKAFGFAVVEGDTYFVKVDSPTTYPFKMVYSSASDGVTAGTTNKGDVALIATSTANIYRFVVPAGLGIVSVFMNVSVVNASNNLDIAATLSIQKTAFDAGTIGLSQRAITSINNNVVVDAYAREKINEFSSSESASRLKDKKVIAFGDSITYGTEGGYVKYLSSAFGTDVINKGSGGAIASRIVDIATAGEGLPRRNAPTETWEWETIDYTDLACATLMIGTNDSSGSVESFGTFDDIPKVSMSDYPVLADYWALFPNNLVGNLSMFVEFVRMKAPKAEIHLITPVHKFHSTEQDKRISKMFPAFEWVAKFYGVHLIFATNECGIGYKDMHNTTGRYTYDGVHLNALGNEVFGKYLAQKVLSFG